MCAAHLTRGCVTSVRFIGADIITCVSARNIGATLVSRKGHAKSSVVQHPVDIMTVWKQLEPWAGTGLLPGTKPEIKLKVIYMESGETRVCDLDEAKTWDWSNPEMMRMIGGAQITSWDKLVEIVLFKAKKGYREVELYEAPRFLMLGGG